MSVHSGPDPPTTEMLFSMLRPSAEDTVLCDTAATIYLFVCLLFFSRHGIMFPAGGPRKKNKKEASSVIVLHVVVNKDCQSLMRMFTFLRRFWRGR